MRVVNRWLGGAWHYGGDRGMMLQDGSYWWERRWVCAALAFACAIPLLWPTLPPLADLPGHMGRWHIAMTLHDSADLQRYYDYRWAVIPNLGMDLLVPALASIVGLEFATKLAVIAIPVLTAAGLLWTAREAHGRVPPTALFALPLVYAWPFQFGFVNFALAQGLAFCAFALWLRMGRQRRFGLRAALFVVIACVLWVTHSFGWGMFGLMAGGAELSRLRSEGKMWTVALVGAGLQCLPLALPVVFMVLGPRGAGLDSGDWFNWPVKLLWVVGMFRDRWQRVDVLSVVPLFAVLCIGARAPRLGMATILGWPALLCLAAFLLLPRLFMGGSYVDMRMIPAATMLAIIAIKPASGQAGLGRVIAWMGLAFLVIRLAVGTVSFVEWSHDQQRELAAIDAIPRGAAVLALVAHPCKPPWSDPRRDHLPGLAVVRRDVFVNEQWALDGQQLLRIRHPVPLAFRSDPSQLVFPDGCPVVGTRLAPAIAAFPRSAFTHVWTIGFPPGAAKARDLRLVWSNGRSALYRVVR